MSPNPMPPRIPGKYARRATLRGWHYMEGKALGQWHMGPSTKFTCGLWRRTANGRDTIIDAQNHWRRWVGTKHFRRLDKRLKVFHLSRRRVTCHKKKSHSVTATRQR